MKGGLVLVLLFLALIANVRGRWQQVGSGFWAHGYNDENYDPPPMTKFEKGLMAMSIKRHNTPMRRPDAFTMKGGMGLTPAKLKSFERKPVYIEILEEVKARRMAKCIEMIIHEVEHLKKEGKLTKKQKEAFKAITADTIASDLTVQDYNTWNKIGGDSIYGLC